MRSHHGFDRGSDHPPSRRRVVPYVMLDMDDPLHTREACCEASVHKRANVMKEDRSRPQNLQPPREFEQECGLQAGSGIEGLDPRSDGFECRPRCD